MFKGVSSSSGEIGQEPERRSHLSRTHLHRNVNKNNNNNNNNNKSCAVLGPAAALFCSQPWQYLV